MKRLACLLALACWPAALAQVADFDGDPIRYVTAPVADPIACLQRKLDEGNAHLDRDPRHGYLESVLRALGISPASQVLVFSKTSFQRELISPETPRALYFGDDVYIGWVQHGEVLEAASVDPGQGVIFYTLSQDPSEKPRFVRRNAECLQCHASSLTKGVPGLLVRSVFPDPAGQPVLKAGTFTTDHSSPLKERWGGWYVTGTHGAEKHMGNSVLRDPGGDPALFDSASGLNVTDLSTRLSTGAYLTPHSDIAALLVLEHETQMHNLITSAGFQARIALRDERAIREVMKEPPGPPGESTLRRFEYAARPLLKYLLLVDQAPLRAPIRGTSGFVEEYEKKGPRDRKGRSLRDLDLTTKLFRHAASPLIYSESIDGLPPEFKEHLLRRLWEVLTGKDASKDFASLGADDRRDVLEILLETRPGIPDSWRQPPAREAGRAKARL